MNKYVTSLYLLLILTACSGGGNDATTADVIHGLDQRISNTDCVAHEPVPADILLTRKFSSLVFDKPVAMLQRPGNDAQWYVVEKRGTVKSFSNDDAVSLMDTFIDITSQVDSNPSEAGLLSMAFHPDFANNGEAFLSYTARVGRQLVSRISRFQGDSEALDPATEEILIALPQPYSNHNGGHLSFGPDGYLYIGFGDGGSGSDPDNNAQNIQNLFGTMLRINVDASDSTRNLPYAIPAGNPFASSAGCPDAGCPEIYAWGLRNPWRWSFDRDTDALWCGDVGQNRIEEVVQVDIGKNYGWRCYEGSQAHVSSGCEAADFYVPPVTEYRHDEGCSITGGYVYRGSAIPELQGRFIFGDYCSGNIWAVPADATGAQAHSLIAAATGLQISSFAEDLQGELYVLDLARGGIYLLETSSGVTVSATERPDRLSATGCFKADTPAQPVDALIPYDLNAAFWSDGAEKSRWIALPDNQKITIDSTGDWLFPVGSLLIKEFRLNNQRVETRFLEHRASGWSGYTYQWDEDASDALLLATGKTELVQGQNWVFPSPEQCLECHTTAAGHSLGPETGQLNRLLTYPSTGIRANQLTTLAHIGLLENPPAENLPDLVTTVSPTNIDADIDLRARAYLHTNCSQCHRPGGTTESNIDLRYQTSMANRHICNVTAVVSDLNIADAKLLAPADPARSIIAERMKRVDETRMPPLSSLMVDAAGVALIDQWITSISSCSNPS